MQDQFSHIFDSFKDKNIDREIKALPPGFIAYFAEQYIVTEEQHELKLRQLNQENFEAIKSVKLEYAPQR